jgi:hypothetical protein
MIKRNESTDAVAEVYDVGALTAVESGMAIRRTITQCLATQYPPCEGNPN